MTVCSFVRLILVFLPVSVSAKIDMKKHIETFLRNPLCINVNIFPNPPTTVNCTMVLNQHSIFK